MKPFYELVKGDLYRLAGYGVNGTFTAYRGAPSYVTRRATKKTAPAQPPHVPQAQPAAPSVPLALGETSMPVSATSGNACVRCGWARARCDCPPPHASALDRAVARRQAQTQAEARAATAAGFPAFPGVIGMGGQP